MSRSGRLPLLTTCLRADVGAAKHHTVASGDGVDSRAEPFGHPRKNIVKAEVGRFESLHVIFFKK